MLLYPFKCKMHIFQPTLISSKSQMCFCSGSATYCNRSTSRARGSPGARSGTISEGKLPFLVILAPKRAVSGGKPSPGGGPMRAVRAFWRAIGGQLEGNWRDPLILEGVSRASGGTVPLSATKAGVWCYYMALKRVSRTNTNKCSSDSICTGNCSIY
jgi:hypothetical protein